VALTLTPMLCAKILKVQRQHGPVFQLFERGFNGMADGYARTLGWAVRHRLAVIGGSVATVVLAVLLFANLKREFVPPEDRGYFVTIVFGPEGSSLQYTDGYQKRIEEIIGRTNDVQGYFSIVGAFGPVSQGIIFTLLTDWDERERGVQDVIAEVQPQFFGIPGVFAFANNPPAFGGFSAPVAFVVQDPNFDRLLVTLDTMVKRARMIPGLVNVNTDLRVNKPELTVEFDRDRAEDLGVPVRDVAGTLQTLLGGRRHSRPVRARPGRGAGAARRAGVGARGRGPAAVDPLQPRALVHPHGEPRAGLHAG
jgi:multidrug efflux pump